MLEHFKITAMKLRRKLKITMDIPQDYINNTKSYPLLIVLDSEKVYDFFNESTKEISMQELIAPRLDKQIICGIQSPTIEDWATSEKNPYYNKDHTDVDTMLSTIFCDYIVYDLIPTLKERYRITDEIYILGFNESAITALHMHIFYDEIKGAISIHPDLDSCNDTILDNLNKHYNINKPLYLFHGGLNSTSTEDDKYYKLCRMIDKSQASLKYEFDSKKDNTFPKYKEYILKGIEHLIP